MDISRAIATVDQAQEGVGSVSGTSALSAAERIFVDVFIANGGKGTDAALAAGFADASAHVSASRMLCRKRVADAIRARCETFLQAALPVAIKALLDIAGDELAQRKDRIKAATSILERGGLAAPGHGVQVNVAVMNGSQAQSILTEVHEARSRRLSGIPPAMSDTFQEDMQTIEAAALPSPESIQPPPGGSGFQGPPAGTCPVPAPPTAKPVKPTISCECPLCRDEPAPVDDGSAGAEFRRAFDEGE